MYRLPLVFTPQPEGGYTVTSPVLPELLTEGDTLEETLANVREAAEGWLEVSATRMPLDPAVQLVEIEL